MLNCKFTYNYFKIFFRQSAGFSPVTALNCFRKLLLSSIPTCLPMVESGSSGCSRSSLLASSMRSLERRERKSSPNTSRQYLCSRADVVPILFALSDGVGSGKRNALVSIHFRTAASRRFNVSDGMFVLPAKNVSEDERCYDGGVGFHDEPGCVGC